MSSIASWSYKTVATIWRAGERDEYGRFQWSQPEYIMCCYQLGGAIKYVESTGQSLTPKATYWTEMRSNLGDIIDPLKIGDKIQLGEQVGNPTSAADDVRVLQNDDMAMFTMQNDYVVMT